jgi:hypothetical protein
MRRVPRGRARRNRNSQSPSFQIVADSPGITERALAVWLRNPHPNMPDFILPQADMENVIAYIMSLKSASR